MVAWWDDLIVGLWNGWLRKWGVDEVVNEWGDY